MPRKLSSLLTRDKTSSFKRIGQTPNVAASKASGFQAKERTSTSSLKRQWTNSKESSCEDGHKRQKLTANAVNFEEDDDSDDESISESSVDTDLNLSQRCGLSKKMITSNSSKASGPVLIPGSPTSVSQFCLNRADDIDNGSSNESTDEDDESVANDEEVEATRLKNAEFERARNLTIRELFASLEKTHKTIRNEIENDRSPLKNTLELLDSCDILAKVIHEKHIAASEGSHVKKKRIVQKNYPETIEQVTSRLKGSAEVTRSWIPSAETAKKQPNKGNFMRVTDESSQAKFYTGKGFFSGGSVSDLTIGMGRANALSNHLSWRNRKKTCFISVEFSPSNFFKYRVPKFIERDKRRPSRCTIVVTGINSNSICAAGLPILSAREEHDYYLPGSKREVNGAWLDSEVLIPFRVDIKHIYGAWSWETATKYMRENKCGEMGFYNGVMLPAFEEHEAARKEGRPFKHAVDCICSHH